ncbi:stalk domain-containing protein [Paenibacillus alvei]|uniref:stalk domain-containing protein n=1 Tax=Paenibacillus alvei TaxID=44250 RepID=UPI0013DA172E|nr:stalk domain-containing protein [Paenibacillus alvei]NEZ41642.1 copper amine oxidase N-terminal domain-containing protein [Paenibacillus alvei]
MKSWKKLFVACVAAVQLFTVIPVFAAEGTTGTEVSGAVDANTSTSTTEDNSKQQDENQDVQQDKQLNSQDKQQVSQARVQPVLPGEYDKNVVVLIADSNKIYQDGNEYTSPQPITIKKGVSYIAIRSLIDRFGFKLDFDNKTKETIIKNGDKELRYKMGSADYRVNGVPTKMKGASYIQKDVFMVPVTSAMDAMGIPYKWEQASKRIIIQLSAQPVAKFKVNETDIIAGETRVTITDQSTHPLGRQIVETDWEGLQEIYDQPGTYTITLRVRDEDGEWSDPYSQTINVQKPHTPPVASFRTDKTTYKMGEPINYDDLSTDEEDTNLKREWTNKQPAFFEPGEKTITLKVTNKYGLTAEVSQTINITDEVLYSFDDFNRLFTPAGDIYPIDGTSVLSMQVIKPKISTERRTLYRSNSPENVKADGILYQDRVAGGARVFAHHINNSKSNKNMRFYILAQNISDHTSTLTVQHMGIAGPSTSPQQTGKMGTVRYFESFAEEKTTETTLKPNEMKIIVPELNQISFKPGQVFTLYADVYADSMVEYTVVGIDADKDVFKALPTLPFLDKDEHIRGTYDNADITLTVDETVGEQVSRLVLADAEQDIAGSDMITLEDQRNKGNYGVLYRIRMNKVAPHTLISFNSRGGSYSGGMFVNGKTVQTPTNGSLKGANEASVLYRTGDYEESVELLFSSAAGSNLPVNLVFTPLPKPKS